jgi:hypothetical protein
MAALFVVVGEDDRTGEAETVVPLEVLAGAAEEVGDSEAESGAKAAVRRSRRRITA